MFFLSPTLTRSSGSKAHTTPEGQVPAFPKTGVLGAKPPEANLGGRVGKTWPPNNLESIALTSGGVGGMINLDS